MVSGSNGVVTGWSFNDSAGIGDTISGPIPVPATWGGTMAVSGPVYADIQVGDTTKRLSTAVSVLPRTWPYYQVTRPIEAGNGDLPYPPSPDPNFNWKIIPQQMGSFQFDTVHFASLGHPMIQAGPNTGWRFTAQPLPTSNSSIYVNQGLSIGDPFYIKQTGGTVKGGHGVKYCKSSDVDAYRSAVLQHEGSVAGWAGGSHFDVYSSQLGSVNINGELEKLVGFYTQFDDATFNLAIQHKYAQLMAPIDSLSAKVDSTGPVNYSCYWRF
jgi:hypothetical protein